MKLFILFHFITKALLLFYVYANNIDLNKQSNSFLGKAVIWNNSIKEKKNLNNIQYHTKTTSISDLIASKVTEWNNYDAIIILISNLLYQDNDILSSEVMNHSIKQSALADIYTNVVYQSQMNAIDKPIIPLEQSSLVNMISKSIQIATKSNLYDLNIDDFNIKQVIDNTTTKKVLRILVNEQDLMKDNLHDVLNLKQNNILYVYIQENNDNYQENNRKIVFESGNYHRILSTDTIDNEYYSPEGSEYSIYYGNTYLYITPDIFSGILTGLFIIFVVVIGLNCLGSIQGMSSFYDRIPAVGKEA